LCKVNYPVIACRISSACNGHENRGRNRAKVEGGHLTQVEGAAGLGGCQEVGGGVDGELGR